MLAAQCDCESEGPTPLDGGVLVAVDQQRDFLLVGVDDHLGRLLDTVCATASGDMDERLRGPGRLVEVERVLLQRAVEGDETLDVATFHTALVTTGGAEVGEVPHEIGRASSRARESTRARADD